MTDAEFQAAQDKQTAISTTQQIIAMTEDIVGDTQEQTVEQLVALGNALSQHKGTWAIDARITTKVGEAITSLFGELTTDLAALENTLENEFNALEGTSS